MRVKVALVYMREEGRARRRERESCSLGKISDEIVLCFHFEYCIP